LFPIFVNRWVWETRFVTDLLLNVGVNRDTVPLTDEYSTS
jgi:hypothetical protein